MINNIYIINRILLSCVLGIISFINLYGQEENTIRTANEYMLKGEKNKALEIYHKLAQEDINTSQIHNTYINLMLDAEQYKEALNYIRKCIRRENQEMTYVLDLGWIWFRYGDRKKAQKIFDSVIHSNMNVYTTKVIIDYLTSHQLIDHAVTTILQARKQFSNEMLYILELANLYRIQNNKKAMIEEYLKYATRNIQGNLNYTKQLLQIFLPELEDIDTIEELLHHKIQENPDSKIYLDLLIWTNLQQKNFYGAIVKARAYDKRFKNNTSKTLKTANIALSNEDFENAEKGFSFVLQTHPNPSDKYNKQARLGRIRIYHARVKNNNFILPDSVRYLIHEYQSFIEQYPDDPSTYEAKLDQALLYAYTLDEKEEAVQKLNQLLESNRVNPSIKSKAKLELGNIYLLKGEPWESTLLYSQVERNNPETPIGYYAKLLNAKLAYYKGEFQLAQEYLDILKEATTREIANDAMELSIRIKENTIFDSTGTALKEYAKIELLLYQNKIDSALEEINNMKTNMKEATGKFSYPEFSDNAILDDVYWLEANLWIKQEKWDKAFDLLQQIIDQFGDEVLADDAYFLQADIAEHHQNKTTEAIELYRTLLDRFPASLYAAEARKRYRNLKGETINLTY